MKTLEKPISCTAAGVSAVSFCHLKRDAQAQKAFPLLICVTMEFLAACRLGCKHFRVVVHACCEVLPPSVFCFPPLCVELMSKPFCYEFSPHSLVSVSQGLEEQGFSTLAGYAVASFLLNGIPYDNTTNLLSKSNVGSCV